MYLYITYTWMDVLILAPGGLYEQSREKGKNIQKSVQ